MAVSKQPSITPETSSGEGLDEEISSRGEAKWKRFHPFRVVRKIFRRRIKREGTPVSDASKKSWSTSELQSVQDDAPGKCEVTSPLKIGLSVSHDSIFSPESNATGVGSEALSVPHGSSLSVHHTSIKNMFKDELFTRVRARRDSDDDDDDIGLPRSPCTSPTTVDVLTQGLKEKSSKSQTTCSAGSLISMGSSENDEDSAGHSSGHSSRMSLIDRRSLDSDGDVDLNISVPLNHNAAHHKIAVKPKRKYGLPRRRMNQIAAAKMNTLPATPEVMEDSGKNIQKCETVKMLCVEKSEETSISSRAEIVNKQQSDLKAMHSSFSCNEMSDIMHSFIQEKTSSESNVYTVKGNKDYDCKSSFNDESIMKTYSMNSNIENPDLLTLMEKTDKIETSNQHEEKNSYSCFKQTLVGNHEEFTFREAKPEENSLLLGNENFKNIFSSKEKFHSSGFNCALQNHVEEPIKVSSLVKNIERSESFKNVEKSPKSTEKIENIFERGDLHQSSNTKQVENNDKMIDFNSKCDRLKQVTLSGSKNSEEKIEHLSPIVYNESESVASGNQDKSKLDIDCEFILKPLKKDEDLELICKQNTPEKESLISSEYFEDENVMSSKTLSMGVEEGGIFVSHHASIQNDLKDMLVTEAHNYVAVEDKNEIYIQNFSSKCGHVENNESWVSHVLPSKPDVTVSSSSTICDRTMIEDKITISVNSKQGTEKSIMGSQEKDLKENEDTFHKPTVLPKSVLNQKISAKEKQSAKAIQKAIMPDVNLTPTSTKNINSQKRVSVEIVPFSQRMKERKYQPISFANKEAGLEKDKKSINAVERKFSDRKVTTKSKEVDKTNSRHSFSGVIPSDKKEILTDKKPLEPEKTQYPVQIRMHKSVSQQDGKDVINKPVSNKECKNSFTKVSKEEKLQMQSPKIKQKDIKIVKDDKLIAENIKWEVKIQPAVPYLTSTSEMFSAEENSSPVASEKSYTSQSESQQSSFENDYRELHLHQELESPLAKNSESNCKSQKEIQPILSDEPEPELLRVFARRSIKQKHCHKDKLNESEEKNNLDTSSEDLFPLEKTEESNEMISISHKSTVIKISEGSKSHIKPDLKKKSKSFSEKERALNRSISPLKEINLIHSESPIKLSLEGSVSNESTHPRQRVVSVPDVPLNMPPDVLKSSQQESKTECSSIATKEEFQQKVNLPSPHQPSGSVNGNVTHLGTVKENQDILGGKEAHAPSWLQLAQQRRELREQRERLLLGGSPNSFMDASNKPSRSSKVWDMVNNFQKLQMT